MMHGSGIPIAEIAQGFIGGLIFAYITIGGLVQRNTSGSEGTFAAGEGPEHLGAIQSRREMKTRPYWRQSAAIALCRCIFISQRVT